ncbi:Hypothetical protein NTJ_01182 [Nesidiocoris tenuis]|uniref:ABC transporter domain-containing protein n=1 Tax=Nesidiocoris tenuis TaxID=355587 RepID=A0ABN7A7Y0_9HEMI|nr:Hypothetical protein NTJ_01182 [Nesidiocoris tenuis]
MINISGKRDVPTSDSDINDNIKIWFNNKWPISPVVYLNGINNVILRALMPKNVSANYGIQVTMQGMNLTAKQMQTKISQKATSSLLHSICLLFSLSFVPASFTIYLIEERISGCKHLQLLSGVNWAVYWIHVYLWDLVCHTISALFCIVTLLCFQEEAYVGSRSLPCLTLLVLLFGWSSIPMMYPATFFFQVPSSAFVALASFNISIGVLTTASTYVLRLFEDEYLRVMRTALSNIFLIFPHFCLGDGLMKLSESYFLTTALAGFDVKVRVNLLAWNYLGKNLVFMFLEGIVFFIAVLCYERFQRSMGLCTEQPMSLEPPMNLDGDVDNERERILNLGGKDEVLVLKCLTKVYKSRKHIAVNQLCLGVGKGQCFGLIGLNGAGKTSTFKMLTGDTGISFGDATVLGHSVRDNLTSVRSLIGYCPQFDALDSKLTPEEHLRLYASLRNIPKNQIPQVVNCCLTRFDLWGYRNVCSLYLSGGNKRKLSTAIAMMGDPQLIFLDEPTCGMDPKARRFLWSRVKECVARGRAVVMTSHSMSECEALCSRLSIMVSGQFMCLGSIQHLKSKFGKGYNLVVRAPLEKIGLAKKLISGKIPEAIEKSEHYTQVKYHVDVETFSLFNILTVLEDARENQLILDYSLSQKSLGEVDLRIGVFVHFVSHQALAKQHDVINRWDCCRLFCCPGKLVTTSHISSSDDFPHRNPSNQTSNGSFQNAQRQ